MVRQRAGILSIVLAFNISLHADQMPAGNGWGSYVDKRTVVGVMSGVVVALLVMAYYKVRAIADYTGNTPIGVVRLGELNDAELVVSQIQGFASNPLIKGILLLADSPGGAAGTSYVVHHEILRAKKFKPVVALIENGCYSGGYYAVSAAHYVVASGTAGIGNIGVISRHHYVTNAQRYALEGLGVLSGIVHEEQVFAGHSKVTASTYVPLTPNQRHEFQGLVDQTYQLMLTDIARARKLDIAAQAAWAEGQIFLAPHALSLGLIDQIGTISDLKGVLRPLLKKYGMGCYGEVILVPAVSMLNVVSKYILTKAQGSQTSVRFPLELHA